MRVRRSRLLVVPVVAASLALGGCTGDLIGSEGEGAQIAAVSEIDVVATINGEDITGAEVAALVEARAGLLEDVPEDEVEDATANLTREVIGQLLQLRAVEQAVETRFDVAVEDIVTDEAIAAQVDEAIAGAGGPEAFEAAAAEQGIDLETARTFSEEEAYIVLLVRYIQDRLGEEGDVTDAELRAQYDADTTPYQSSDVNHILLETEEEALAALARLEAGEEFTELAIELSTGPSGPDGGALGVAPRGSYVPEFSDAVYADDTVVGEVIGPIQTDFGFHLILVNEITLTPFDEVAETLRQTAAGDAYGAFIDSIFDGMQVTVDESIGTWNGDILTVEAPVSDEPDAGSEAPAADPTEAGSEG